MCVSVDASFDSGADSKSITGYVIYAGKIPLLWKSKKQTVVAQSSCEAELVAINQAYRDLLPIQGLMSELIPSLVKYPISIRTDSQSAMELLRNGGSALSRHFHRRLNVLREELIKGNAELVYVPTEQQSADLLTKPFSGSRMARVMHEDYCVF